MLEEEVDRGDAVDAIPDQLSQLSALASSCRGQRDRSRQRVKRTKQILAVDRARLGDLFRCVQ